MKSSEWKKKFDKENPGALVRAIPLGELLSITEWDDIKKSSKNKRKKDDGK